MVSTGIPGEVILSFISISTVIYSNSRSFNKKMLIFLLLWLALKRLLWLLWPVYVIVACTQTVIVACPCIFPVIVTSSCYCGLLSNSYCGLPMYFPCYCDLFMLLWLVLEPVIVYSLTPIDQFRSETVTPNCFQLIFLWNDSKYVILHILAQWWLVPPENAVLFVSFQCMTWVMLIVKWNEWNVGN